MCVCVCRLCFGEEGGCFHSFDCLLFALAINLFGFLVAKVIYLILYCMCFALLCVLERDYVCMCVNE